jgi:2-polyprenyl-6-methoxyphenol hydroxylase-like FAD-dependent oxidoreductase
MLDALIVGGGPTGLSLAALLRAVGASVRIVDRQRDRVHESRALAVQPRTLEVLRAVGLSQPLVDRGLRAVSLQMHLGSRVLPIPLFDVGLEDTAYPFLLFISQAETEAILNQHLAAGGVHVERPVELVAFEQDPEVVTCTLRHADGRTEQAHARYLVGCDGSRSTVRALAGIAFAGGAYPQRFALGDLEVDGELEHGTAHVFMGERGMLFFFPLGTPATWRMLGMLPSAGHAEVTLDDLQAMADDFSGGGLRLRDPVWVTDFRIRHQHAAHYRAGRVFVAGDAAHVHSPAGAQGMNTGIQDAWNLGWKLWLVASGVAGDALLDSYEAERWPVGRFVLRFTDRAFRVSTASCDRCAPRWRRDWRRRGCAWSAPAPTASVSCRNSTSATGAAPSSRRATPGHAAAPERGTGSPTPGSCGTGSPAGCRRHWPRPATTCCCADRSTAGTASSSPPSRPATAAWWPCTGSPASRPPRRCTTPTGRRWPASECSRRRRPITWSAQTVTSASAAAAATCAPSSVTSPAGSPARASSTSTGQGLRAGRSIGGYSSSRVPAR